jgi:hypothetical protein
MGCPRISVVHVGAAYSGQSEFWMTSTKLPRS